MEVVSAKQVPHSTNEAAASVVEDEKAEEATKYSRCEKSVTGSGGEGEARSRSIMWQRL